MSTRQFLVLLLFALAAILALVAVWVPPAYSRCVALALAAMAAGLAVEAVPA
jgi:hypothetical protein